ncbi:MAG: hypothetical protein ACT4QF_22425 [Sporichthyaceae bacterium]
MAVATGVNLFWISFGKPTVKAGRASYVRWLHRQLKLTKADRERFDLD